MLRKLMIGTVAAAGLMMAMGVSADAGCRPRGAYGPRGGFPGGPGYGYGGYGYGGGVVLSAEAGYRVPDVRLLSDQLRLWAWIRLRRLRTWLRTGVWLADGKFLHVPGSLARDFRLPIFIAERSPLDIHPAGFCDFDRSWILPHLALVRQNHDHERGDRTQTQ